MLENMCRRTEPFDARSDASDGSLRPRGPPQLRGGVSAGPPRGKKRTRQGTVESITYGEERGGALLGALLASDLSRASSLLLFLLTPLAIFPRLLLLPFQGLLLLGVQFLFANNGAVLAVLLPQRVLSCFQLFRSVFTHKRHGDVGWGSVRKRTKAK